MEKFTQMSELLRSYCHCNMISVRRGMKSLKRDYKVVSSYAVVHSQLVIMERKNEEKVS